MLIQYTGVQYDMHHLKYLTSDFKVFPLLNFYDKIGTLMYNLCGVFNGVVKKLITSFTRYIELIVIMSLIDAW
jgi:hypothetical protein